MNISVGMAASFLQTKKITQEELNEMIKAHVLWLENPEKGKRADLSGLDLDELDLSGADLTEAKLNKISCIKTKMNGINLTRAIVRESNLTDVDLSGATLDYVDMEDSHLAHSNLQGLKARRANFISCILWDNDFKEAQLTGSNFMKAQLCDCNFTSAKANFCTFQFSDLDYACFKKADLSCANLTWTSNIYWANFEEADLTYALITECSIDDEAVNGAKGIETHIACPEDGSFIAWRKSHDNRIVKIKIPENASRSGGDWDSCRASEAEILDILEEGHSCEETSGLFGDDKVYHKGEIIKAEKFDGSLLHDGDGIHFYLSKAEAEHFEFKKSEDEESEDEDGENESIE